MSWICKDEGIPFKEETFDVDFLKNADEVIITNTSVEIMGVIKLDGEQVGNGQVGPITKQLQTRFNHYIDTHCV